MDAEIQKIMRNIPSMDKLLALPWIAEFEERLGRETVKALLSDLLAAQRAKIIKNRDTAFDANTIAADARRLLARRAQHSLRKVVNATGVVIHTNLGRSLLAREAVEAVNEVAGAYNTLEYSLDRGERGQRNDHVEWLLCRLTGAEAALAVNNNAAAVVLALSALAKDKESVVSRGELVEIGGSFRIPDIMALSGTKMVEVGTTNRTHAPARLRGRDNGRMRDAAQDSPLELPRHGLPLRRAARGARLSRAQPRPHLHGGPRQRYAHRPLGAFRARTTRPSRSRSRPAATSSPSRATSCSAGRR